MDGKELKEARRKLGFSQQELADALGMSKTMIGYMERGYDAKRKSVGIERRTELAVMYLLQEHKNG